MRSIFRTDYIKKIFEMNYIGRFILLFILVNIYNMPSRMILHQVNNIFFGNNHIMMMVICVTISTWSLELNTFMYCVIVPKLSYYIYKRYLESFCNFGLEKYNNNILKKYSSNRLLERYYIFQAQNTRCFIKNSLLHRVDKVIVNNYITDEEKETILDQLLPTLQSQQ
jgi:hypothetical protein